MFKHGLPHFAQGTVIKGFGRGSKELGIPTANLPPETIRLLPDEINTGIYFGWANVDFGEVHKMVMSVGWNPYYKNDVKSMEVYIIHGFDEDFYGSTLRICMLGYIRPEMDFTSLDDLLKAIKNDIQIAERELDKPEFKSFKDNSFFKKDKGLS
ncbi:UNVERIFIED_CONTAM: hypothetical protein PYX00_007362 [Menopon gallinae]|uniref:Riboflavin kinase n=1 Tax=Menopon gallinae TaxID=328185 RepID=A0AAW2HJ19_9NEOP